MIKFKKLLERIEYCGQHDPAHDNPFKMMAYLMEEIGEAYTCLEVDAGMKKRELTESFQEEIADVAIASLGIYFSDGGTIENLTEHMNKKIQKWEKRINAK